MSSKVEITTNRKKRQKTGGRSAGTPNKATSNARQAIAKFVDGNSAKLNRWLTAIEKKDGPKAAFECFCSLLEYHVPKLSRSELSGADGGDIVIKILSGLGVDAGKKQE